MSHAAGQPHVPALKMGVPIPNGKLGMWLFLGTEIMFFTAFIGTYIVLRLGSKGWPSDPAVTHIVVEAGAINTFVLICSSVSVVLAHEAMGLRNFKRATNWIIVTTLLACVFLGIKSYEYYGKWSHDILPSHVAESPRQALDKLVRELNQATGLVPLRKEEERLKNALALKAGDETALNGQLTVVRKQIDERKPVDEASKPLKDLARAGFVTAASPAQGHSGVSDDALEKADEALKALQVKADVGKDFQSVHEPHYIPYGNTFASIYFVMTGFHALHVIIGMGMFGGIIWMGQTGKLGSQHAVLVENCGLYWHFVDLVWIFLFPLIYII